MAIVQRGDNTYLIRIYLGRHSISKKRLEINETFHGTYEEALKHELLLKERATKGEVTRSSRITVARLIEMYLDNARHYRSEATQRLDRDQFNRYVLPHLGSLMISKVKTADIQQFLNFLLDRKKESNTHDQKK